MANRMMSKNWKDKIRYHEKATIDRHYVITDCVLSFLKISREAGTLIFYMRQSFDFTNTPIGWL